MQDNQCLNSAAFINLIINTSIIGLVYYQLMPPSSPDTSTKQHPSATSQKSCLQVSRKSGNEGIICQSWSAIKKIMQDVSQAAQYSFAKLTNSKQLAEHPYSSRKPSKMTIELIRNIHRGFDTLELSCNRWNFQQEEQKRQQSQLVEQLVRKQALITRLKQKKQKKIVRIEQPVLPETTPLQRRIQELAHPQNSKDQRFLQYIAKWQQEQTSEQTEPNKEPLLNPQSNCNQQAGKNQYPNASAHPSNAVTSQKKKGETIATVQGERCSKQQVKVPRQNQSQGQKPTQLNQQKSQAQSPQTKQRPISHQKPQPLQTVLSQGTAALHSASETSATAAPALSTREADKLQKAQLTVNRTQNPFLKPAKNTLRFKDLFASQTSSLFNNNTQVVNPIQNNEKPQNAAFFAPKNKLFLQGNQNSQAQQQDKKAPNADQFAFKSQSQLTNPPKNERNQAFTSLLNPLANSLPQQKPLVIPKKGLATHQMTTSPIFTQHQHASLNQLHPPLSDQRPHQQSQRVSFLANLVQRNMASNFAAKDLFSVKQTKQSQGLFTSDPRQATEKKPSRNSRRLKKQTRIS